MSPTRRVPTRALFGIAAGFLAAACSAAVATTPASAAAGLACPDPTSRPFAPWGDQTWYKLAPNGREVGSGRASPAAVPGVVATAAEQAAARNPAAIPNSARVALERVGERETLPSENESREGRDTTWCTGDAHSHPPFGDSGQVASGTIRYMRRCRGDPPRLVLLDRQGDALVEQSRARLRHRFAQREMVTTFAVGAALLAAAADACGCLRGRPPRSSSSRWSSATRSRRGSSSRLDSRRRYRPSSSSCPCFSSRRSESCR